MPQQPSSHYQSLLRRLLSDVNSKHFTADSWIADALGADLFGTSILTELKNGADLTLLLRQYEKLAENEKPSEALAQKFIQAWQNAAIKDMATFEAQDILDGIMPFIRLGIMPSQPFLDAWRRVAEKKIDAFSANGLSHCIYALAKLEAITPQEFLGAWRQAVERRLPKSTEGLANAIDAFSRFGVMPAPEFLHAWQVNAMQKIQSFSAPELSQSINALARLRVKPLPEFLYGWHAEAIRKMQKFDAKGLANCIHAFARFEVMPSQKFLHAWYNAAIKNIESFSEIELSKSIHAFAKLGIVPSTAFVEVWQKNAISKIARFNERRICNSIYSLAVLSAISDDQIPLPPEFTKAINSGKYNFSEIDIHQLYLADKFFSGTPPAFNIDYEPTLSWTEKEKNTVSKREKQVEGFMRGSKTLRELQRQGFTMHTEKFIPEIASCVDICFKGADEKTALIVQIDSHYHYIAAAGNRDMLDGSSQFQNKLLGKLGIPIIRFNLHGRPTEELMTPLLDKINDTLLPSSRWVDVVERSENGQGHAATL